MHKICIYANKYADSYMYLFQPWLFFFFFKSVLVYGKGIENTVLAGCREWREDNRALWMGLQLLLGARLPGQVQVGGPAVGSPLAHPSNSAPVHEALNSRPALQQDAEGSSYTLHVVTFAAFWSAFPNCPFSNIYRFLHFCSFYQLFLPLTAQ